MDDDAVLQSLRGALAANPDDVPLRLHLAQLPTDRGRFAEAIAEAAVVLQRMMAKAPCGPAVRP